MDGKFPPHSTLVSSFPVDTPRPHVSAACSPPPLLAPLGPLLVPLGPLLVPLCPLFIPLGFACFHLPKRCVGDPSCLKFPVSFVFLEFSFMLEGPCFTIYHSVSIHHVDCGTVLYVFYCAIQIREAVRDQARRSSRDRAGFFLCVCKSSSSHSLLNSFVLTYSLGFFS